MRILVTGGAGYVGSHALARLREAGHDVLVVDDLSSGHEAALRGAPFRRGDIRSRAFLDPVIAEFRPEGAMHFAGVCSVPESVRDPIRYHDVNVGGSITLVAALEAAGVERVVFSSSAAVYGEPAVFPIPEHCPRRPTHPYGATKEMTERLLSDAAAAGKIGAISLRYFNAAGARSDLGLGEDHEPETHLIPNVLRAAAGRAPEVRLFGTDYDTPDGTCVRDYVHVDDLALAHVAAVERTQRGRAAAYNLGSERGHSVREVICAAEEVAGRRIPVLEEGRRAGDPPRLVAGRSLARTELGWIPQRADLREIVESQWRWMQEHPNGYGDRRR